MSTVEEIERAINSLTPEQIEQLYQWLDEHHPQRADVRLASDLAAGRFDDRISRALDEYEAGRTRPL